MLNTAKFFITRGPLAMHLTPENVTEIGQAFVDGLVSRLGCELPGRYLANLLHDPDYLDRALTEAMIASGATCVACCAASTTAAMSPRKSPWGSSRGAGGKTSKGR